MLKKYLLVLLLIHVSPGRSQLNDFLPSFSIFSYTTPRTIKHTNRPKTNTQSSYNNDDYINRKPTSNRTEYNNDYNVDFDRDKETQSVNPVYYYSTEKTVRKTTKNNHRTNFNTETYKDDGNSYKTDKIEDLNEVYTDVKDQASNGQRNYDGNPYNFNNHKTTHSYYELTTKNPFYEIPGVKPALIDNRPPITNRPVHKTTVRPFRTTRRPYLVHPRPTDSGSLAFPDDDATPDIITGPDEENMSEVDKQRYVELAERKCDTYKSFHVKQLQAIPLLPSPEPVQVNISSCAPTNVPLIVGGKVVNIADFPHMALIGWPDLEVGGYSWKCGGSLISDQYVLTAGHCTYLERDEISGPPRVVQLGSSLLDDPGALVVRIESVIRHPKYKPNRSYYDIALLKLTNTVKFSELVKPACLGVAPHAGKHIIATGWGQTQLVGNLSLELRSVSLPIWDIDSCARVLGSSRKMPTGPSKDSQLCAGEPSGGKDTCQGDSGGPAQVQEGCIWRVVAVTSIGRSCAAPNTPGLYSLVHIPFIAAQVFGGHRNKLQNNDHSQTQNNNQHSYDTQNNNRNNFGITNNNQGSYQPVRNDNRESYNTQKYSENSYSTNNNRPNVQNDNENSYSTYNNKNDQTQNNNRRYGSNGYQESNLRRQDKRHENNNQNNQEGNNNQQSTTNINVYKDFENDRTENNRFNSYNKSNRNLDRSSQTATNNNYYRNEQQNSRTDNQQQSYDNNRFETTYDNNDKPIWWT